MYLWKSVIKKQQQQKKTTKKHHYHSHTSICQIWALKQKCDIDLWALNLNVICGTPSHVCKVWMKSYKKWQSHGWDIGEKRNKQMDIQMYGWGYVMTKYPIPKAFWKPRQQQTLSNIWSHTNSNAIGKYINLFNINQNSIYGKWILLTHTSPRTHNSADCESCQTNMYCICALEVVFLV